MKRCDLDLIFGSDPKFDGLRDQLLLVSNAKPIYASSFKEYYQEFYGVVPNKTIDFIVRNGETPVLLFFQVLYVIELIYLLPYFINY